MPAKYEAHAGQAVRARVCLVLLFAVFSVQAGWAEDETPPADIAAGHSKHGEAFNEGPRQRAHLIPGTGDITFAISSKVEGVQKFIEQGVGQLHGFWYFEAERSFRQAAMLDPECAIAYWGMAMANTNNKDRAQELIEKAFELREQADEREQKYIDALHTFLTSSDKKKEKEAAYVKEIEALVEAYPDDIEAKALLGYALYKYRASADRTHAEVDVVLDAIHAKAKNHPAHHYRIHLWDYKSPQRALDSAARCGPSAPAIAHMWHMCGHIFSRVKRFGDAAWFQEASARVDHRHMMHDQVLPDQIHNFAHNNEWFIRNMMNVGRVREALDLARNMIELPRHPTYNMLDKRRSASYGRDRLINVLERFELWEEAIALSRTPYLEPTDDEEEQLKRLRLVGEAYARSGRSVEAEEVLTQLTTLKESIDASEPPAEEEDEAAEAEEDEELDEDERKKREEERTKEREKKEKKWKEDRKRRVERADRSIACVRGHLAWQRGEHEEALRQLKKADEDALTVALVQLEIGKVDEAVKAAKDYAKSHANQVRALAGLVEVLWKADKPSDAREAFVSLRANSHWLEIDHAPFIRLAPIAAELGFPADWRVERPAPTDLGKQPPLASLGPFRWRPVPAADWLLPDSRGHLHSLRSYRGRPVIVVFYLGYGCLHCAEQLQALAPKANAFAEAGIDLIAVSTDNLTDLDKSQADYDGQRMPFPLVADPTQEVFRAYRCYDDFEATPLHGTFLIDGSGRIRWQDISYEPFMDVDFLLQESKRLLDQGAAPTSGQLAKDR